jgi:hypothetical protein
MSACDGDDGNVYQVDTLVQLSVTFYNTALNLPADPSAVSLFVQDPNGVVTQIASNLIVRTGVGAYYSNFMPTGPGEWTYKWRGSGPTSVQATSPDVTFFVKASELITS